MLDCPSRETLIRYVNGDDSPLDAARVQNHVESCAACFSALTALRNDVSSTPVFSRLAPPSVPRSRLDPAIRSSSEFMTLGNRSAQEFSRPRIPGYEILRELGKGGNGIVYLARDLVLGRQVAVKMILQGDKASGQERVRFRTEALAMAELRHPNLVQVHSVGEFAGSPYCVMEYVAGGNLRQRMDAKPLPATEAAKLLLRLAEGVSAIHAAGIIHRDLKPENVLMVDPQTPKIGDFGLALRLHDDDCRITQTGVILGTPLYLAPEQAVGRGHEVTPSADVYALGAILYETLTGVPPIRGQGTMGVLAEIIYREPISPRKLVGSIPLDLETICLKCLEKDPHRRYLSANQLVEELQRFLEGKPTVARPLNAIQRLWRWCQRKPSLAALWALSLAAVLFAILGVFVHLRRINTALERVSAEKHRADAALEAERQASADAQRAIGLLTDETLSALFNAKPRLSDEDRAYLKKIQATCEQLAQQGGNRPEERLFRAENLTRVALILNRLGETKSAEESFLQAETVFNHLLAEQPDYEAARLARRKARFDWSGFLRSNNRRSEARKLLQAEIATPISIDDVYHKMLANLALLACEQSSPMDPDDERRLEETIEQLAHHPDDANKSATWVFLISRHVSYLNSQSPEQSELRLLKLLRQIEAAHDRHPTVHSINKFLVTNYQALIDYFISNGKLDKGIEHLERKIELLDRVGKAPPIESFWAFEKAYTLTMLGHYLGAVDRFEEGIAPCAEAAKILERLSEFNPMDFNLDSNLARSFFTWTVQLNRLGRHAEAIEKIETSIAVISPWLDRKGFRQSAVSQLLTALDEGIIAAKSIGDDFRLQRFTERKARFAQAPK